MNGSLSMSSTTPKLALLATVLAGGLVASSVGAAEPATATPGERTACSDCHSLGGTVTAVPSTATPAAGGAYVVNIAAPTGAGGARSGYWISDSGGATVATSGKLASPAMTASLTAPSAAGSYTYTVWATTGHPGSTNQTTFTITVASPTTPPPTSPPPTTPPAPTPSPTPTSTPTSTPTPKPAAPRITRLTPARARVGATVTILGRGFARRGVVSFAAVHARVTSWSTTRIVVKVPRLAPRRQAVTVTPGGGRRSNAMAFTVLRRR